MDQVYALLKATLFLEVKNHTCARTHTPSQGVPSLQNAIRTALLPRQPQCLCFLEVERFTLKFGLFHFDGLIHSHFKRREPNSESASALYYVTERVHCFHSWARISFQDGGLRPSASLPETGLFMLQSKQGGREVPYRTCPEKDPFLLLSQQPMGPRPAYLPRHFPLLSIKKRLGRDCLK